MPADVGTRHHRGARTSPRSASGPDRAPTRRSWSINDLLGLNEHEPKFAKAYADLRGTIARAAADFAHDVEAGTFPDEEHSYR